MSTTSSTKAVAPPSLWAEPPSARQLGFPVLFAGVRHCRLEHIRQLLRKRFAHNLHLNGIDVHAEGWYVYVRRVQEVSELIVRLDGLAFFGGRLCVRYVAEDGRLLDLHQLNEHVQVDFCPRLRPRITPPNGRTEFAPAEMAEFKEIFRFLDQMVVRYPQGVDYKQALRAYRHALGDELPAVVRTALRELPQVLAGLAMHGKHVDERGWLRTTRALELGVKLGGQTTIKTTVEAWEPFSCTEIVDPERLVAYMRAMLREFGPLDTRLDLRLRLAVFFGDATFEVPATVRRLCSLLEAQSALFFRFNHTLFDLQQPTHRTLLRRRSFGLADELPVFSTESFLSFTRYEKPEQPEAE
ncbi:hypothetical protein M3Y99_01151100 [Aphelenchoides fujianensis]|nr:hypothetical protein M3Y99_01151100 [Aphelenchoides fujianensis]